MNRSPAPADSGFVLVVVLTVLVVLTLLATAVATSAERAISAVRADSDRFASTLAMSSTRETLLFLLATQRQTVAGLTVNPTDASASTGPEVDEADGLSALPVGNEIRLDGTPYQGLGSARFAIQDDHGLLSVNFASPLMIHRLFQQNEIASAEWDGMDAKRLDFQDADDLHRLNGAEKMHYARAGQAPPTNRTLHTPLELRRILGWDKLLSGLDDAQLLSLFTMSRTVDINVNTAPASILQLLPGLTPSNAERMVELRRGMPFSSLAQLQRTFGIGNALEDGISLFAFPSGSLILWDEHSGARQLLHWTLTPLESDGPPWRIDYEVTLPRGYESDQIVVGTPPTPLFTAPDTTGE